MQVVVGSNCGSLKHPFPSIGAKSGGVVLKGGSSGFLGASIQPEDQEILDAILEAIWFASEKTPGLKRYVQKVDFQINADSALARSALNLINSFVSDVKIRKEAFCLFSPYVGKAIKKRSQIFLGLELIKSSKSLFLLKERIGTKAASGVVVFHEVGHLVKHEMLQRWGDEIYASSLCKKVLAKRQDVRGKVSPAEAFMNMEETFADAFAFLLTRNRLFFHQAWSKEKELGLLQAVTAMRRMECGACDELYSYQTFWGLEALRRKLDSLTQGVLSCGEINRIAIQATEIGLKNLLNFNQAELSL